MKKMALFVLSILVLVLNSCGGIPTPTGDFSLTLITASITIRRGSSGTISISVNKANGFANTLAFQIEPTNPLPNGVTASFNPASSADGTTLSLNVSASTALGTKAVVILATGGGKTHTKSFNLIITNDSDTTKPRVISVSPANGTKGVSENQKIVIRFSEPMDSASARAAYQSNAAGIRPGEVSFSWDGSGTILTVSPHKKLKYKPITNLSSAAYSYTYKITNTATDVAGNHLANPQTSRFYTLRKMTQTIYGTMDADIRSDGKVGVCGSSFQSKTYVCVGDSKTTYNADYKAFFGFSITSLPDNIGTIVEAKFYAYHFQIIGSPYADLILGRNRLIIEHVYFGPSITFADFNTAVLAHEGNLSFNSSPGYKVNTVTSSVKDDYEKRKIRANHSQFRLRFGKKTDGNQDQDVALFRTHEYAGTTKDPKLVIIYLIP